MLAGFAFVASAKPFLLFLMLMGAVGLGVAMSMISAVSWLVRLPGRRYARRSRGGVGRNGPPGSGPAALT
jgi:hypothetical protein